MRRTIRRASWAFIAGFIVTFLIYLLIRFDSDKVLLGMAIGVGGGAALIIIVTVLSYKLGHDDGRETSQAP